MTTLTLPRVVLADLTVIGPCLSATRSSQAGAKTHAFAMNSALRDGRDPVEGGIGWIYALEHVFSRPEWGRRRADVNGAGLTENGAGCCIKPPRQPCLKVGDAVAVLLFRFVRRRALGNHQAIH